MDPAAKRRKLIERLKSMSTHAETQTNTPHQPQVSMNHVVKPVLNHTVSSSDSERSVIKFVPKSRRFAQVDPPSAIISKISVAAPIRVLDSSDSETSTEEISGRPLWWTPLPKRLTSETDAASIAEHRAREIFRMARTERQYPVYM